MIEIIYDFIFLNEYIAATNKATYNRNKGKPGYNPANKIKRDTTNFVYYTMLNKPKIKCPARLKFIWLIKDKRRDLDNIAFAKKYILDGFVKAGIIPNDGLRYIIGFTDEFEISSQTGVRIEVV